MKALLISIYSLLLACLVYVSLSSCANLGYCNGHGLCKHNNQCECFEGWGAASDVTTYRAADCSTRVCPSGMSWGDIPTASGENHRMSECSDKGWCDRVKGQCTCVDGFEGSACQRMKCPNDCSGHGRCMTMERLASKSTAIPLTEYPTTYLSENVSLLSANQVDSCDSSAYPDNLFFFHISYSFSISISRALRLGTLGKSWPVCASRPGRWDCRPTRHRRRSTSDPTAPCVSSRVFGCMCLCYLRFFFLLLESISACILHTSKAAVEMGVRVE